MIEEIMEKEYTRLEFIKIVGIGILALMFFPSLIMHFFKEEGLTNKGNQIYLNGNAIMEIKDE